MYTFLRPLLFRIDPERAHELTIHLGRLISTLQIQSLIKPFFPYDNPCLHSTVAGMKFKNPVGLASGFDKNGYLVNVFPACGFGFIEIGTVTPRPQVGNPRPRLFRLSKDYALVNRMGFNNEGAEALAKRLARRPQNSIIGVSIGKNKDTANEDAIADYEHCFKILAPYVDYVVVNVSSPNTPHLRELQEKESLRNLLMCLKTLSSSAHKQTPLFLKIAPDLSFTQLDDIVAVVREQQIAGVIAVNTTTARRALQTQHKIIEDIGAGGLSGKPLKKRGLEHVHYIYKRSKGAFPIIGIGGIFNAEDAYDYIKAGASLVQVYTGLIYEGPGLVKSINQGLVYLLKRDGFNSVQEAVGKRVHRLLNHFSNSVSVIV